MKNPRKKTPKANGPALAILSQDGLIAALNTYVAKKLTLSEATAAHDKTVADLNTAFDAKVQPDREEVAMLERSIQLFCHNHKADLFTDPKSRDYANARVGFALNPEKVDKLLKDDTFDAIAARLAEMPWGEPYVTYKGPILDKEALLRDRAQLDEQQLCEAGIAFTQDERFFIEIKATSAEGVTKPAEVAAA